MGYLGIIMRPKEPLGILQNSGKYQQVFKRQLWKIIWYYSAFAKHVDFRANRFSNSSFRVRQILKSLGHASVTSTLIPSVNAGWSGRSLTRRGLDIFLTTSRD